jgi:ABC-type multidrug transport system ATPase subunit
MVLFRKAQINKFSEEVRNSFDIQMDSTDAEMRSLSGGNQQKTILGRELSLDTPFLLLDQPTRGLDVGSIEYVHEHILQMKDEGHAILLLSADLEELFRLSDRILVLHRVRLLQLETEHTRSKKLGSLMWKEALNETECLCKSAGVLIAMLLGRIVMLIQGITRQKPMARYRSSLANFYSFSTTLRNAAH